MGAHGLSMPIGSDIYGREAMLDPDSRCKVCTPENDLSGEIIRGNRQASASHPGSLSRKLGNWGITAHTQVVAYETQAVPMRRASGGC